MPDSSRSSPRRGVLTLSLALSLVPASGRAAEPTYHEPYRLQFHFTPPRNWMNDPNGLVFYEGNYHLFYQYNPQGDKWGHMSWGHATSRDLFHWENQPIALAETGDVMIFSGSAVVDWKNTSGFGQNGKPPLVAVYTGDREKTSDQKRQDQRLAYSNDGGRTWTQYAANPVLDLGMADFRDPKVFWHEPTKSWVLVTVLATEKKVRLFSSPDLKKWTALSDFGPAGSTAGVWECPDLFPLPVEGEADVKKWVLLVSTNPGGPARGSGSQYFVGNFDGSRFVADAGVEKAASSPAPSAIPAGKVFADFEGQDYAGWTTTGTAFGTGPSHNLDSDLIGFVGKGYVDSSGSGDSDTGKLTSPSFKIEAPQISFLMGGGNHPSQAGMNLLVDGKVVRTSTGNNSPRLEAQTWDVSEFIGKTGTLEIFDNYTSGDWGHILVDQIVFGARLGAAKPAATRDALWVDYGSDYYAGVTYADVPPSDGRRISQAWMSNWSYAQQVPTSPWRGAMTTPRVLSLRRTSGGLRLVQQPVAEIQGLRKGAPRRFAGGSFAGAAAWLSSQKDLVPTLDVEMTFNNVGEQSPFALNLRAGPGEVTTISCDPATGSLTVDRTHSGVVDFNRAFAVKQTAPVRLVDGRLTVRIVLDVSSLEVFAQGGETVITDAIFPSGTTRQLELTASMADAPSVDSITLSTLNGSMDNNSSTTHYP